MRPSAPKRQGSRLLAIVALCLLASSQRGLGHETGAYSHDDDPDSSNADWMANDCLKLSEISMQGTHDSMARIRAMPCRRRPGVWPSS